MYTNLKCVKANTTEAPIIKKREKVALQILPPGDARFPMVMHFSKSEIRSKPQRTSTL